MRNAPDHHESGCARAARLTMDLVFSIKCAFDALGDDEHPPGCRSVNSLAPENGANRAGRDVRSTGATAVPPRPAVIALDRLAVAAAPDQPCCQFSAGSVSSSPEVVRQYRH